MKYIFNGSWLRVSLKYSFPRPDNPCFPSPSLHHGLPRMRRIRLSMKLGSATGQEPDRLSQGLFTWVPSNQCPVPRPDTTGELNRCPDYQTRRAWNNIRMLRILLARIIREQSAPLLRKSAANASSALEKLHRFTHISGALSL